MLEIRIVQFLDYCKVSNLAEKSIESLRLRLNEFNRFMNKSPVRSIQDISCRGPYTRATDTTGSRNFVLIMMLGLLGLRLASVISLNIEDVDIERGIRGFPRERYRIFSSRLQINLILINTFMRIFSDILPQLI